MKKPNLFICVTIMAFCGLSFSMLNEAETYNVNPSQSVVNWKAYKVTGAHEGTVAIKSGSLKYGDAGLTGGSFVMDMTSIIDTDMTGGGKERLENHLKSADFFDVAEHPTAKFEITKAISRGTPGDYKITGNLTIKGITKEIRFVAKVDESASPRTATAAIQLDRTDFDVRFRSGSFFENLGDKTIYDEFDLNVKLVLDKVTR